jgi:hypothetical protein
MWQQLLIGLALVMVVEGLLPFINPAAWKKMMHSALQLDENSLRFIGLTSMIAGLVLLYLVR